MKILSEDGWCGGRNVNRALFENNSELLPLSQPAQLGIFMPRHVMERWLYPWWTEMGAKFITGSKRKTSFKQHIATI